MQCKLAMATLFFVFFAQWAKATTPGEVFKDAATEQAFIRQMNELMTNYPKFSDDEYRQRLMELSGAIDFRLDPVIKDRIIIRTELYRESTENILGLSDVYFPIFEEYLAKYDVPHHLKYLPIVESNLNPIAKSPAAAMGLWQFMPSTGAMYGLRINRQMDERCDTYKASEAAASLLRTLYDTYGDWAMALAAYNCGPGRLNGAARLAKSNNYWEVRKFLPKETQKYVPYFMAMVYVGEYYRLHQLKPKVYATDYVLTDTIVMYEAKSMYKLAQEVNLSLDTLKFLNPAYFKNYIPANPGGTIIVLPSRVVAQLRGYEAELARLQSIQTDNELRAIRRIQSDEDLNRFAKAYRCTRKDILIWNNLPDTYVGKAGDVIAIRRYRATSELERKTEDLVTKLKPVNIQGLQVVGIDPSSKKALVRSSFDKPVATPEKAPSYVAAMPAASANKPVATTTTTTASKPVATTSSNTPSTTATTTASKPVATTSSNTPSTTATTTAPSPRPGSYRQQVEQMATNQATAVPVASSNFNNANAAPTAAVQTATVNIDASRSRERRIHNAPQANIDKAQVFQPKIEDNPNEPYLYYTVKGNETISDIHKFFPQMSVRELLDLNDLKLESSLRAGQVLKIRR